MSQRANPSAVQQPASAGKQSARAAETTKQRGAPSAEGKRVQPESEEGASPSDRAAFSRTTTMKEETVEPVDSCAEQTRAGRRGALLTTTEDERTWGMITHLSAALLGFLGPLIIWLIKKERSRFLNYHGKECLNFCITIYFCVLAISISTCGISFVTYGLGSLLVFPCFLAIIVIKWVMLIMAGLAANKGELYRYAFGLRLIPQDLDLLELATGKPSRKMGPERSRVHEEGEVEEDEEQEEDAVSARSRSPVAAPSGRGQRTREGRPVWLWVSVGALLLLAAVGGAAWWWLLGGGGSLDNLDKVEVGMTEQEVQHLLGKGVVVDTKMFPGNKEWKMIRWRGQKHGLTMEVSITVQNGKSMIGFKKKDAMPAVAEAGVPPRHPDKGEPTRRPGATALPGQPDGSDALTAALETMKSEEARERIQGCDRLVRLPVDAARRAEVGRALQSLLASGNPELMSAALRALAIWATRDNVTALLRVLEGQDFNAKNPRVNSQVLEILGRLQDNRAVSFIAPYLLVPRNRAAASKALQAFGPLAEEEALKYLSAENPQVRMEICRILKVIGTAKSVPGLKAAQQDRNKGVAREAQNALREINNGRRPDKVENCHRGASRDIPSSSQGMYSGKGRPACVQPPVADRADGEDTELARRASDDVAHCPNNRGSSLSARGLTLMPETPALHAGTLRTRHGTPVPRKLPHL
jgi:uncharacterized Tic20 family protein